MFTGALVNAINSAKSVMGYCATADCPLSRVTTTSAAINISMDRFSSWNADVNLRVNTTGAFKFEPISATGFSEFKIADQGLSFSQDCVGVTLGKDQTTDLLEINVYPNIKIAGPIRFYFGSINLRSNLETTASGSEIRAKTPTRIYLESSKALTTNGGDVVMWTNSDKVAGTDQIGGPIYH